MGPNDPFSGRSASTNDRASETTSEISSALVWTGAAIGVGTGIATELLGVGAVVRIMAWGVGGALVFWLLQLAHQRLDFSNAWRALLQGMTSRRTDP